MKASNLFLKNWTLIVYLWNKIDKRWSWSKFALWEAHITERKGERTNTTLRRQRKEERERRGINKKAERIKKGNERTSKRERGKYYRIKNSMRQSLYYSGKIKEEQKDNVYLKDNV